MAAGNFDPEFVLLTVGGGLCLLFIIFSLIFWARSAAQKRRKENGQPEKARTEGIQPKKARAVDAKPVPKPNSQVMELMSAARESLDVNLMALDAFREMADASRRRP